MSEQPITSLVKEYSDAERFRELLRNPSGSSHLFSLLSGGKGNEADFIRMLDRIIESRANATVKRNAGQS